MPLHQTDDGIRIHYDLQGQSGPLLALMPGLGGDGRFWAPVAQDLARDHRLVVIDHRGAGRSDRPAQGYSLARITRDTAGLLASLGEKVHFIGHSTGGAIAQRLGLETPGLLHSLVLSCSWGRADARFAALFEARAAMIAAGLAGAYQHLTHVLGHSAPVLQDRAPHFAEAVAQAPERLAPFAVTAARVRMVLGHDLLDQLPALRLPCLVIAAAQDEITPPPMARALAQQIPGARLIETPGPHFLPQEQPLAYAALLRAHCADLGA